MNSLDNAERYVKALVRLQPAINRVDIDQRDPQSMETLKKMVLLFVKFIINKPVSNTHARCDFDTVEITKQNMAMLTPAEFMIPAQKGLQRCQV